MTLITIGILTSACVLFELILIGKSPKVRAVITKSPLFSLIFSLVLSWVIGLMFSAHGLIVLAAAVLSTVLTQPVYSTIKMIANRKAAKLASG